MVGAGQCVHARSLAGLLVGGRDGEREAHVGCLAVPNDRRIGIGGGLEV